MKLTNPPAGGIQFETSGCSRSDAESVVAVRGELDIATAGILRDLLVALSRPEAPDLVIDMSGVTFCDSQGIGALQAAAAHAETSGGTLTLAAPRPNVAKVLRISTLDQRLRIIPDLR